jgi:hypothetical protein
MVELSPVELIEAHQKRVDAMNGENLEVAADATPLDFLCAIFRDPQQPMQRRMKAAIEAAPYYHPKLSATAIMADGSDFATRLDQAIRRSGKVIEHSPTPVEPTRPVPMVPDRQFRRA